MEQTKYELDLSNFMPRLPDTAGLFGAMET
jgi:hypothetical protein